jgi:membrane-associated phospholipid phosphatase
VRRSRDDLGLRKRACAALACVGALALFSGTASAAEDGSSSSTVEWQPHWRKADAFDYALSLGLFAGYGAALILPEPEREADWSGPVLLDAEARRLIGAEGLPARNLASTTSDIAFWLSIGHVLADATLFAMVQHDSPEIGWEMLVMDAEAYAATLFLNAAFKRITSRARPYVDRCTEDPSYDPKCGDRERFSSFYSGHAAVTATSAGLLCSQHRHLPLYGDGWDTAACVNGLLMTSLTGALRIVSDRHWASDVIVGHGLGFASGFFLPKLLHFRPMERARSDTFRFVSVLPTVDSSGAMGVFAFGAF